MLVPLLDLPPALLLNVCLNFSLRKRSGSASLPPSVAVGIVLGVSDGSVKFEASSVAPLPTRMLTEFLDDELEALSEGINPSSSSLSANERPTAAIGHFPEWPAAILF